MKRFIMKRISVVLSVLVTVYGLYAQDGPPPPDWSVTVSGYGKGAFTPIQYAGESKDASGNKTAAQTYTGLGASWGFQYPSLGLTVNAGSETIGVHADVQFDKTGIAVGNNGYAYVKPFGFVSMKFGKYIDGTLGGKVGGTDFSTFVLPEKGEDNIFTRFLSSENTSANAGYETSITVDGNSGKAEKGVLLFLTPIKGLTLGLNLPSMGQAVSGANTFPWGDKQTAAEYVWGNAQATAGYAIEGVGLVRAQYVGVKNGVVNAGEWKLEDYVGGAPNSRVEAAFAYTGVQGLTLDVGGKYYLPTDGTYTDHGDVRSDYARGVVLALGAQYNGGGFGKGSYTIEGRVDGAFGGKYKVTPSGASSAQDAENGINLNAHLSPSYNLGVCTIGGDFGFELQSDNKVGGTEDKAGYTRLGAGIWFQKDLGVAKYIKAGVGAALPYTDNADNEHGIVISVPIIFQYIFF
ncbi:MAG: hypothetical protein LBT00_01565 [Spirochaetaceae bacterium]|jgi:hypothetical protein|nr:hypothetical protein [Spirochaetaceae bacterium]